MTVKDPIKTAQFNGNVKSTDKERLLIPQRIDEIARTDPNRPWVSLPYDDDDLSKGYEDISFARLAAAANRLSWLVRDSIGTSSSCAAIAYFGPSDVRYGFMQMAAAKTGHKVLFCSTLNSDDVNLALLAQTKCKAIFSASVTDVSRLVSRSGTQHHFVIPELDDLLDNSQGTEIYPFPKTYEEAKYDPYFVLHTSGTTGIPKSFEVNHEVDAATERHHLLGPYEGRPHTFEATFEEKLGTRYLVPLPQPHASMSVQIFRMTLFHEVVLVPGLRHRLPRSEEISTIIKHANVDTALLYPYAMEYIAGLADGEQYMKGFRRVYVAGAAVAEHAAKAWSRHTTVQNFWGSTEVVITPHVLTDRADWEYCAIDMDHSGLEFRPIDSHSYDHEGNLQPLYQLFTCLKPTSDGFSPWHACKGITLDSGPPYPELDTKDLWTPHRDPSKAHYMWKFVGRADDMMSLTTGNNIYRADIQRWVAEHESVHAALVVGSGHSQTLLVVELAADVPNDQSTAVKIWNDVVDPMNKKLPLQGCIAKSHVLLEPHGSFVRTIKGSVARRQTEAKFVEETENLYKMYGDKPPVVR